MACPHRAALAEKCPQTYAHNARGFPLLAMSAGPDTEESPGWLLLERSEGAYSFDIDGNRYIDWNCGFGPHILGFNNPIVLDAVKAELDDAGMHSVYWHTRHKQEKLAELLAEASPSVIEKVHALFGEAFILHSSWNTVRLPHIHLRFPNRQPR